VRARMAAPRAVMSGLKVGEPPGERCELALLQ
jgi:hypothetical protein